MPPLHKQQHTGPGGQGAEGRFLPAPHLVRLTGTMMTRVGAVGCWLLATASAAELGVARDSTELADLQAQLQQALDQQAQLNNQQEALTNALTPLLSWANHMAPHDTGCDLDHYTSILTLCGADASATETTVAPELDPVAETDASCECMDSWVYKGRRFAGCQVTDQPPRCISITRRGASSRAAAPARTLGRGVRGITARTPRTGPRASTGSKTPGAESGFPSTLIRLTPRSTPG